MKKEQVETSIEKNVQNFETQFKKSTTQLLILHLLSKREVYAYEFISETLKLTDNVYKMPLLYHIMNKLESDGFIEKSRREISENNRVRVYYRITERGIHYLNEITGAYSRLSQSVSSILFEEESNP